MRCPMAQIVMVLVTGFLVTLSSAVTTCPPSPLNETTACLNVAALSSLLNPCTSTFQQYACSDASMLSILPDDLLVTLSGCYSNVTLQTLDPIYSALFVSKLDNQKANNVFSQLSSQFSRLSQQWRNYLLAGIWARITQNLNSSMDQTLWIPLNIQPFLTNVTPDMIGCLQKKNITCATFQALVKSMDAVYPNMSDVQRKGLYPALKMFLISRQNLSGSACSQNVNSSAWLQQNFGKLSAFAEFGDFVTLNANFSALDILSSLTVPQMVNFSLAPATSPVVAANIAASVVGTFQNATDVYNFLNLLNTTATSNNISVSPQLSQALLSKSLQLLNLSTFNSSDWTQLLQVQLSSVLPAISADQLALIPSNLSCDSYQAIIKALDSNFSQMATGNQKDVYTSFIKPYLTKKGNTITCFNQTNVNSSAWFVTNMASFMTYSGKEDLTLFANDTMLQIFASDASCVQLASRLNFPKDMATYYTYLLTSSGNVNLSSVPVTFLCYLTPSAIKNLNDNDALAMTNKINKQCFTSASGQAGSTPTPQEVQVAISLVSNVKNLTTATITNLGQSAVGLSPSQINSIGDKDLQASVSSLSNVSGWSNTQSRAIMNRLLNSNYQIDSLQSLGSLVSGLPSQKMQELDPKTVLNAAKDAQFASKLSNAPAPLQNAIVKQITTADPSPANLVKNVPAGLVGFIPKYLLQFNSEKPALNDVNGKSWSPDQAAMFFDGIVNSTSNYSQLSSSVLQGFTCATPSTIGKGQVTVLAKAMKAQNAALSEDQLNCLTKQITTGANLTDLSQYPQEVFLFLNSSTYANGSCRDFFANVGMANISVLEKGSPRRTGLLQQSLSCMNVNGFSLTDDNVQVLGQLTCDLNSTFILSSTGNLLTQLTQCKSFTADQQSAILQVISSGKSPFGAPSSWTKSKLNSLGAISGILSRDVLTNISSVSFNSWMQDAIQNSVLTRKQLASIVSNVASTRARRAAGCPDGKKITASTVTDPLLPLNYSPTELDACLDNQTLTDYLGVLTSDPLTDEQLAVLKSRLDMLYPGGYPGTVISDLGAITFLCGPTDVNKWNLTADTLGSLFAVGPTDAMAQNYIGKYISSGNPLNGSILNIIGSDICLLTSAQLDLITPSALSDAKALDISACNQTVKNTIYGKAKIAYQGTMNQSATYYNLIKPYLGGAPTADLKSLAAMNPNMDIGTFIKLNPTSVVGLNISDVKSLLGSNIGDLAAQQSSPVVSTWIQAQKQSDLDSLGLGLQGGIRDYSNTTLSSNTTTLSTVTTTTLSSSTTKKASSSAPAIPPSFYLLVGMIGVFLL